MTIFPRDFKTERGGERMQEAIDSLDEVNSNIEDVISSIEEVINA